MIRVIIADDHHLVRQGLRALLEISREVEVIGEASTGYEAVELVEKLQPDVVVMDLSMPRLDGVQAATRILDLKSRTEVVIVSMHADTAIVQNLVRRGVKGYLLKDALSGELMFAIRSAAAGKLYLSPTISEAVMNMLMTPSGEDVVVDLTHATTRSSARATARASTSAPAASHACRPPTLSLLTPSRSRTAWSMSRSRSRGSVVGAQPDILQPGPRAPTSFWPKKQLL